MSTWQAAGRSGEAGWLTIDSLSWDRHFFVTPAVVPQTKTSKPKLVAFAAGVDRHLCWYTLYGDYLAMVDRPVYKQHEPYWLFPDLHEKVSATYQLYGIFQCDKEEGNATGRVHTLLVCDVL
jgi:hypothetical protein